MPPMHQAGALMRGRMTQIEPFPVRACLDGRRRSRCPDRLRADDRDEAVSFVTAQEQSGILTAGPTPASHVVEGTSVAVNSMRENPKGGMCFRCTQTAARDPPMPKPGQ